MQGRFTRESTAARETEPGEAADRGSPAGPAHGDGPDEAPDEAGQDARGHGPAGERNDQASVAGSGSAGQAGSRLALRNWRIKTRLVALITLPVIAATLLGALRIESSLDNIRQLDDMYLLTNITDQATSLATALQEERDASAGPLVSGQSPKSDAVAAPRDATDRALEAFDNATLQIEPGSEVMVGVRATLVDIGSQLKQLNGIREDAYQEEEYFSQTVSSYNALIDGLLSLSQDMAQATSNSEMIRGTRALAAFSVAKEHASIQRAIITAGLARGEVPGDSAGLSPSDWRFGSTHNQREEAARKTFAQVYGGGGDLTELLEPLDGGYANISSADGYATQIFATENGIERQPPLTYQDWYDQDSTKFEAMKRIERTLLDEMDAQSRALRQDAERGAVLNGLLILFVLGLSVGGAFIVARSMARSLWRLQDTAQEVARKRLPEVVKQMSEVDPQDVDTSVEPIGVYTRDEIGAVAEAFDDVHREAVRLAAEQALLRGNVNAMFTNLSRRSQGLIQRQLSLISELESREADPDQLSSLFKLDHLATRMRRNGENLLVLAGEEPGRRWTRPVPLVDVLRAAASEVEQYERIEVSAVPKTDIAGRVVNDLVHLLAELLENATSFSSPQTKVKITGHALPDGRVLVEIHDTGIGLSPEDLAEINDRLASPPTVDVSVSRRMGLFVVGRLSLRHNIRIQLRPSDTGGTTALVMLPADVAQGGGRGHGADLRPGSGAPPRRSDRPTDAPGLGQALGRGRDLGGGARPMLPTRPIGSDRPDGAAPADGPLDPAEASEPSRAPARPSWAATGREDTTAGRDDTDATRERGDAPAAATGSTGSVPPSRVYPRPPAPAAPVARASQSAGRPAEASGDTPADAPGDRTGALPSHGGAGERPAAETPRDAVPEDAVPEDAEPAAARHRDQASPGRAQPPRDDLSDPLPEQEPQRAPERTPIFEEMESTWFDRRHGATPPPATPPARPSAPVQPANAAGEPGTFDTHTPWRTSPNDERWRQAEQLRQPAAGGVTISGLPRRVPRANLVAGSAQQQPATAGPLVSRAPDDVRGRLTNLRRGIQRGRQAGSGAGHNDQGHGSTHQ